MRPVHPRQISLLRKSAASTRTSTAATKAKCSSEADGELKQKHKSSLFRKLSSHRLVAGEITSFEISLSQHVSQVIDRRSDRARSGGESLIACSPMLKRYVQTDRRGRNRDCEQMVRRQVLRGLEFNFRCLPVRANLTTVRRTTARK